MSQRTQIHDYMKRFGSITPLEAMRDFGIMRLAARIAELRQEGVQIQADTERSLNRFGKNISYARYSLKKTSMDHGGQL